MMHRGKLVDTTKIRNVALLTVEGENDDISGVGQTAAAQTICTAIPDSMRMHYIQPDVGHYGVFNGSRFRKEIAPRILGFVNEHAKAKKAAETVAEEPVKKTRSAGSVIRGNFKSKKA